jgi:lipopolysaccharide export system permease protein
VLFAVLPRYLIREILLNALGVLAVVLAIFLVRRFGSLLGEVADAPLPLSMIGELLSLRTLMALPSLLPAALYASVLLALGRLHRDNEMTALAACGVGPARTWRTVLAFSLLGAAVVGALSFSVRPWAASRFREVRREAMSGADLGSLTPGRFYELDSEGELVVFAERRSRTERATMEGVFVQDRRNGRLSVLYSDKAIEHRDERHGFRFLQLLDGHRYELRPAADGFEISTYESYEELVLRTALPGVMQADSEDVRPPLFLLGSSDRLDVAELQWQLAMPVSTILLALLALPLSRTDPRRGRSARLFLAILLYLIYRNLLGAAKEWVANGTVAPFPGVWAIHAGCLAVILVLIALDARERLPFLGRSARERRAFADAIASGRGANGS